MEIVELSKPECGWASMHLVDEYGDEFTGSISYILDTPNDLLDAFIVNLQTGVDTAVEMDEEGSTWKLIIGRYDIAILASRRENKGYYIHINPENFMIRIIQQIEDNLDKWSEWAIYDGDAKEVKVNKKALTEKIRKVRKLLAEKPSIVPEVE